eukprot:scaffold16438_cov25-Tisochrysis_lutea.AAC.1
MGQVTGLPQDMKRHQSNQPRRLWTNAAPAALRNAGSNSMPGSMPTSGWSPPDKPRAHHSLTVYISFSTPHPSNRMQLVWSAMTPIFHRSVMQLWFEVTRVSHSRAVWQL